MQVRDHVRQPLGDEATADRPIDVADRSNLRGGPLAKEVSAARSARVIQAARALSAPAAAALSQPERDASAESVPAPLEREGDPGDAAGPAPSARPARAGRPRRRLLNLFPESALQPEPASSIGPQLVFLPRAVSTSPEASAPMNPKGDRISLVEDAPAVVAIDSPSDSRGVPPGRAKDELLAAIRHCRGPVVLTVPSETDTSSLCRAVIQELDRRTVASHVVSPKSFDELLKMVLVDFGAMTTASAAHADVERPRLAAALHSFLGSLASLHARAVVFIDEAETVPDAVLAELPALSAQSDAGTMQLVLVGRPVLAEFLERPDLRDFNASVAVRLEVEPVESSHVHTKIQQTSTIAESSSIVDVPPIESTTTDLELKPRQSALRRFLIIAAVASIGLAGAGALFWIASAP